MPREGRELIATFVISKWGFTATNRHARENFLNSFILSLAYFRIKTGCPHNRVLHSTEKFPLTKAIWWIKQKHSKSWGQAESSRGQLLGSNLLEGDMERKRERGRWGKERGPATWCTGSQSQSPTSAKHTVARDTRALLQRPKEAEDSPGHFRAPRSLLSLLLQVPTRPKSTPILLGASLKSYR